MDSHPRSSENHAGVTGFLVDMYHRFRNGATEFYGIGRLETGETFGIIDDRHIPRFFIRKSDCDRAAPLAMARGVVCRDSLLTTMDREPVCSLEAPRQTSLGRLAESLASLGIRTYEADINFSHQYLMERGIRGSLSITGTWRGSDFLGRVYHNPRVVATEWDPRLSILSLDLETNQDTGAILGLSMVRYFPREGPGQERMFLVGEPRPDDPPYLTCCATEQALLRSCLEAIRTLDPDIITGWNVLDFDVRVLSERLAKYHEPFLPGRSREPARHDVRERSGRDVLHIPGRQVLDCMQLLRWANYRFEDFSLDTVAHTILGRKKVLQFNGNETKPQTIVRLYHEDRKIFCDYCLEDARLVRDIANKTGIIELTINRSRLIGLPLERSWGSVAPFEFIYTGELHKKNMVAPSRGVDREGGGGAPGGLVMKPQAGLHARILVFDFKSLYPSIIRTFNIDPLAFVRGKNAAAFIEAPNCARFDRDLGILPVMLDRFFESRETAKKEGNTVASYAYKIIMNSFYGVLGTDACRFSSPHLAGAITEFGQMLLLWIRQYLESQGFRVLYGDTDSVFVDARLAEHITPEQAIATGASIAHSCNQALAHYVSEKYQTNSRLDLEFEKYYRYLILPRMRGGEDGRAKSYAGQKWTTGGWELEIVGMEAIRTDWTPLAQAVQRTLLEMIFTQALPPAIEHYLRTLADDLLAGKLNEALIYRKNIRKPLDSYTKSTPPHVKAARLLAHPARVIRYYMTQAGPQPVEMTTAPLDYRHYIEKQVIPIVETLQPYLGVETGFLDQAGDKQMNFF
jgi:DNA polymerase-2